MPGQPIKDKVQPIQPGQLPPGGRLTMPIGTTLSNPATVPDGLLGGNYTGPTISQQTTGEFTGFRTTPGLLQALQDWWKNLPGTQAFNQPAQMYNELGQPVSYEQHNVFQGKEEVTFNPVAYDQNGNRFTYDTTQQKYIRDETGILNKAPTTKNNVSTVGLNLEANPAQVGLQTLQSIYPGRSFEEIKQLMEKTGYMWHPGPNNTSSFVLVNQAAAGEQLKTASGALIGPTDERGRPQWVDPTTLARGERVTVSQESEGGKGFGSIPGATIVGGAEYTNPAGSTVSQYAVTVSQNLNKKLEKEGAYKWVSKTVKDKEGNWVRIYSKQLRAPYTKHGQKNIQAKGEAQRQAQASQQPAQQQSSDFNQLVTLRVNYG